MSKLYPIFIEEAQALIKAWAQVISDDKLLGKQTVLDSKVLFSLLTFYSKKQKNILGQANGVGLPIFKSKKYFFH